MNKTGSDPLQGILLHSRKEASRPRMVSPGLYARLCALLAGDPGPGRASLLLAAMEGAEDPRAAVLLTCLLLCGPEAARPLLVGRYRAAASPEALHASPRVLYAACRTGGRFLAAIQGDLRRGEPARLPVAIEALDALARCVDPRGLDGASEERLLDDLRTREKWPPLFRRHLDAGILREVEDLAAALCRHPGRDVREPALRALGRLGVRRHAETVRELLAHEEETTRRAAILAADMGDGEALGRLEALAGSRSAGERRVAAEALGRITPREAEGTLVRLLADPEARVRRAAAGALAGTSGREAQEALRRLLRSGDKGAKKAAAAALRPDHGARGPPRGWPQVARERLLDLEPTVRPFAFISLDAVLRFALPEDRPYDVRDLTRRIARVCHDYSSTRRYLVEEGLMRRAGDVYRFTGSGRAAWRVEQHVFVHYLKSWGGARNP